MDAYDLWRVLGAAESGERAVAGAAYESGSWRCGRRGYLLPVRRAELQRHLCARGSTEVCLSGEASMLTTTTRTREQLCPSCGELVDAATGFRDGAQPADGSFVVCIACAAVMRYGADFR